MVWWRKWIKFDSIAVLGDKGIVFALAALGSDMNV